MAAGLFYMGFLDSSSGLGQVALRLSIVGVGIGLFQAAAYALMLNSVPAERFGTAAAALSLGQAFGTVLSVAVIGGLFAISSDHHLSGLLDSGLSLAASESEAFVRAFRDVFWLGAIIAGVGAGVFLFSRGSRSE